MRGRARIDRKNHRYRRAPSDVDDLYAAGADYVTVTRLSDAHELFTVIQATDWLDRSKTSAPIWTRN